MNTISPVWIIHILNIKSNMKLKILIQTIHFGTEFEYTIWPVFMCKFEMICMQNDA